MTNPFKPYTLITESEKKIHLSIGKTRCILLILLYRIFFLLPIASIIFFMTQKTTEDPTQNAWLNFATLAITIAWVFALFQRIIYETTISSEEIIVKFNRFFRTKTITTKISEIESFEKLEISHSHTFYIRLKSGSRLKILHFDMLEISDKQIPQIINTLAEITALQTINKSLFAPKL